MTTKRAASSTLPDSVRDGEVVYIKSPVGSAVGKCTAYQFREVWSDLGWTISDEDAYHAHETKVEQERLGYTPSPAVDEVDAQEIINAEKGA